MNAIVVLVRETSPVPLWAKSPSASGVPLFLDRHLSDSGLIAGWLLENFLPARILTCSGWPPETASAVARWLAGIHDVGKATPAFVDVIADQRAELSSAGFDSEPLAVRVHHTVTGYHITRRWLRARGVSRHNSNAFASVVLAHHGRADAALLQPGDDPDHRPLHYGDENWERFRDGLMENQLLLAGLDLNALITLPDIETAALPLIEGVVIMADWLASDERLFPYKFTSVERRLDHATTRLKLPQPWKPSSEGEEVATLMNKRFPPPSGKPPLVPWPSQEALVAAARELDCPGLLVLEAPPGEGKTEAALMAAEVLADRFGQSGIFFALPTQATATSLFDRTLGWVASMSQEFEAGAAVNLVHGRRRMAEAFAGLPVREIRGVGEPEDEGIAHVHEWFNRKQTALLANIGVGTIDQVLQSAIPQKHLMLRHLGLASKVVVIDETHAYDDYMLAHLELTLRWLGSYRAPVILLSATLPPRVKERLIHAYTGKDETLPVAAEYPLVTTATSVGVGQAATGSSGVEHRFAVRHLDEEDLCEKLEGLLSEGGTALVVRNTVSRAIDTARNLTEVFGEGEVTCVHSRFLSGDRMDNDSVLRRKFGPSKGDAPEVRPYRHVVVATQVVEQSLDVDFDVLITDLAPIDLVIQRMGRCHRHRGRVRPVRVASPQVFITGTSEINTEGLPEVAPGSAFIYGQRALLASAAMLLPCLGREIHLPQDIVPLVHGAYAKIPTSLPRNWASGFQEAQEEATRDAAEQMMQAQNYHVLGPKNFSTLRGWWNAEPTDSDERPSTRLSVNDRTIQCVVVREDRQGRWWTMDGVDANGVLRDQTPTQPLMTMLDRSSVGLAVPRSGLSEVAETLSANVPEVWRKNPSCRWMRLLVLDEKGCAQMAGLTFRYSKKWGMEVSFS